jgi:hypothetical protein
MGNAHRKQKTKQNQPETLVRLQEGTIGLELRGTIYRAGRCSRNGINSYSRVPFSTLERYTGHSDYIFTRFSSFQKISREKCPYLATRDFEPIICRELLLSTLIHATAYVYTRFTDCTGTGCKSNGMKKIFGQEQAIQIFFKFLRYLAIRCL